MRVNVEDEVKRHLPRLARHMGWTVREALGALVLVWNATQDAEIHEDTPERIATVCALDFDDDEQAQRFIDAMIAAQLASVLTDGRIRIRGNKIHVDRLVRLRMLAPKGGKARQLKKANDLEATWLGDGSHDRAAAVPHRSAPSSPLLAPSSLQEKTTNTGSSENAKPKPRKPKTASPPSAAPPGYADVVACWFAAYEKRYNGQKPKWGDRAGKQLKQLMTDYTSAELCDLVRYFFAWKRPEVIKGGHSFCKGYASFVAKLDELRADIAAPERRIEAAQAADSEKHSEHVAAGQSQADRIIANYARTQDATQPPEQTPDATTTRGLDQAADAAVRDDQPEIIGRGGEPMAGGAEPVLRRAAV